MPELPSGWSVTTQSNTRSRSPDGRWSYVISTPVGVPGYVSPYRYHSQGAAQRAGETDALACIGWVPAEGDLPTWELGADPLYYVEEWAPGSWAAYRGDVSIGEPGTYGTREEAQQAAENERRELS